MTGLTRSPERRHRRGAARLVAAAALLVLATTAGCARGSAEGPEGTDRTTTTTDAPSSTATAPTSESTSTAPPFTLPATPLKIAVAGDSLGFTAAFPTPDRSQVPDYLDSEIIMKAAIGCGVLHAAGLTPIDTDGEGAGAGDCEIQRAGEFEALDRKPEWIVYFTGGWEHLAWVDTDGTVLGARSPQLRQRILDELIVRADTAQDLGVRTAFVTWVCPHLVDADQRGDYARWYNEILREAAAAVPGTIVIEPTDRVCVGADAGGEPTAEKRAAFRDHHPTDQGWVWKEWLGPALLTASQGR